jgi:hypothetical protein
MEGVLTKLCRKVAKRRHFWLLSDCLIYGIAMGAKEKEKEKDPTDSPTLSPSSSGTTGPLEKKQYKFRRMLPLLNSKFLDLADDPSRTVLRLFINLFIIFNLLTQIRTTSCISNCNSIQVLHSICQFRRAEKRMAPRA